MDNSEFQLIPHWVERRKGYKSFRFSQLENNVPYTGCYLSFELESTVCDAIGLLWTSPSGLASSGFDVSKLHTTNVFHSAVEIQTFSRSSELFGWAEGMALGGKRLAIWLEAEQLTLNLTRLKEIAEKNIALNLHVFQSSPGKLHGNYWEVFQALANTGWQIWHSANSGDLIFQALMGRKISENLRVPNLIFHNSNQHFWVPQISSVPNVNEIKSYFTSQGWRNSRIFNLSEPLLMGSQFSTETQELNGFSKQKLVLDKYKDIYKKYSTSFIENFKSQAGNAISPPKKFKSNIFIVADNQIHLDLESKIDFIAGKIKKTIHVLRVKNFAPRGYVDFPDVSINSNVGIVIGYSSEFLKSNAQSILEQSDGKIALVLIQLSYGAGGITESKWKELLENKYGPGTHYVSLETKVEFPKTAFPKRQAQYDIISRDLKLQNKANISELEPLELPYENVGLVVPKENINYPFKETLFNKLQKSMGDPPKFEIVALNSKANLFSVRLQNGYPEYYSSESHYKIMVLQLADAFFGFDPFDKLQKKGKVIFVQGQLPNETIYKLPKHWKKKLSELEAECFSISSPDFHPKFPQIILGEIPEECVPISVNSLSYNHQDSFEPLAGLKRWKKIKDSQKDISSFWGSWIEPYQAGENILCTPEINAAYGEIPPSTSAFHSTWIHRNQMPEFNPEKCNGCAKCWISCPDNAFSAKAFDVSEMVNALASSDPVVNIAGKLKRYFKLLPSVIKNLASNQNTQEFKREQFNSAVEILLENIPESDKSDVKTILSNISDKIGKLKTIYWKSLVNSNGWSPSAEPVLLSLDINPNMCKGCGICVSECQPKALEVKADSQHDFEKESKLWELHDGLPFTSDKIIAAVGEANGLPSLSGIMLSAYANFSMLGGTFASPGSGELLAIRRVVNIAEYYFQSSSIPYIQKLESLELQLGEAIQQIIGQSFNIELQNSLGKITSQFEEHKKQITLESVVDRLSKNGNAPVVQNEKLLKLSKCLSDIHHQLWLFKEGKNGLGRARFGLLITNVRLAEILAKFPYNPFSFPVVISINNPNAAIGLQESLLSDWVELEKIMLIAELLLEWPSDVKAKENGIQKMGWNNLSNESLSAVPKIIVLGSEKLIPGIQENVQLPLKFLSLFSVIPGLNKNRPFSNTHYSATTSLFKEEHFLQKTLDYFESPKDALLSIYCPNPELHGFETKDTLLQSEAVYKKGLWPHIEKLEGNINSIADNEIFQEMPSALNIIQSSLEFLKSESRFSSHLQEIEDITQLKNALNILELDLSQNIHAFVGKNLFYKDPMGKYFEIHFDLIRSLQELYQFYSTLYIPDPSVTESSSEFKDNQEKAVHIEELAQNFQKKSTAQRDEMLRKLKDNLLKIAGYKN